MKRIFLISIIVVALIAGAGYAQMMEQQQQSSEGSQPGYPCQMGPGMMGGYGWGPGMMGGYGMGPGMMGGYGWGPGMMGGYGMGPGIMGGYGMGPGMTGGYGYGYSKEQQKFLDDTADLRRELHSKQFDYNEARRDPKAKTETLEKLANEIRGLQRKIYEKARQ